MIKLKLVFIIILISISCCAKEEEQYAKFFDAIHNYQFEKAETFINSFEQPKKDLAKVLIKLIYNEGQTPFVLDLDETVYSSEIEIEFLGYLVQGYHSLFYEPQKKLAFENFYKAYLLSVTIEKTSFTKTSLLALLKYYSYEIAQNDKAHLKYLNEYNSFFDNENINHWGALYETIFLSKELNGISEDYFKSEIKLKRIINSLGPNSTLRVPFFFELATLFDIKDDKEKAIEYYRLVVNIAGDLPYLKKKKFFAALKLALNYQNRNQQIDSKRFWKIAANSINLADTLRAKYYLQLYDAQINNSRGDFQSAYNSLLNAYRLEFELDYRKNSLEVNRLQVELETEKKEKQILQEQQKVRANRNWLIAACLALVLGAGIAVLFQKNTTKKRQLAEQEALLKQERVDNLLKEQELVSIDAMIAGQEKERQKVANELHDDLGSLMATVKLHFDNVKADRKDPALLNAQKLLDEAYKKIRGMAHTKNSGVMAKEGLLNAVRKMANTITDTNALAVTVEDYGLADRMENSLELTIFRIVQELVANVIKHAGATTVNIQFTQHEDGLNIIVEDNGKGFDMAVVKPRQNGMGLESIEKRIEHLEGSFTVDSVLGKGTSILIDIPV